MSLLSDGLTGLTHATPVFLVAAGLTLTLRVTRLLDLSQAALAFIGACLATRLPLDPALTILAATAALALLGAAIEFLLFRRLYRLSSVAQLLGTLGLFLLLHDVAQPFWTHSAPAPPVWLRGAFDIGSLGVPIAAPIVIAILPLAFGLLLFLTRPANAQPWSRTGIVALSAGLAGLAGALLSFTRTAPPSPGFDVDLLADAFLVILLGGPGSLPGALIGALFVALTEALTASLFPQAALVLPLAATAALLLVRPDGLLGRSRPEPTAPHPLLLIRPSPLSARLLLAAALAFALAATSIAGPTALPLLTETSIALLVAASLHLLVGPGGLPSLGHAAFFGIGAYATALLAAPLADTPVGTLAPTLIAGLAGTLIAGLAALLVGTVLARLSFAAVAMLTLVVARLVWAIAAQLGPLAPIAPLPWLPAAIPVWLSLALCLGVTLLLRRLLYAPFGYALRAARDNPVRAAAIGLPIPLLRLAAFTLAGTTAGLAGALAAFATSSVFRAGVPLDRSADALFMVALGGIQTIAAPFVGALAYTGLAKGISPLWPLLLGPILIALVMIVPDGIAGTSIRAWRRPR